MQDQNLSDIYNASLALLIDMAWVGLANLGAAISKLEVLSGKSKDTNAEKIKETLVQGKISSYQHCASHCIPGLL